jgi:hypothetical protein
MSTWTVERHWGFMPSINSTTPSSSIPNSLPCSQSGQWNGTILCIEGRNKKGECETDSSRPFRKGLIPTRGYLKIMWNREQILYFIYPFNIRRNSKWGSSWRRDDAYCLGPLPHSYNTCVESVHTPGRPQFVRNDREPHSVMTFHPNDCRRGPSDLGFG